MLAVVSCLLISLACQVDRVAAPPRMPVARAVAGTPVILSVTCTFSRRASTVSCAPAAPPRAAGVSADVILSPTGTYATFVPFNLVKDTVSQVWSFDAFLHNALQQAIGTLNGHTVTGSRIYVTDIGATQGSGTVHIINPDGIGNLTAPNQPYFTYNQIVAAGANSNAKLWKVSVPNTVTAVNMDILMTTDFPAEQTVTLVPPDTVAAWVHSDTNVASPTDSSRGGFSKRIVLVTFRPTATLADRQLAIAIVNGVVVGGDRTPDGSLGYYYVQVSDDGSASGIIAAKQALTALPQVQSATFELYLDDLYLRPNDGGDYKVWTLSPDSANLAKKNWSLEMVDAPFAWGCSIGTANTPVGIIDNGFHAIKDLLPNISASSPAYYVPADTQVHGTMTSSILAASGNDSIGITGVMWRANLLARNPQIDSAHRIDKGTLTVQNVAQQVVVLAQAGARAVNVSLGLEYRKKTGGALVYYAPRTRTDSSMAADVDIIFMENLRMDQRALNTTRIPLIVLAAGNFAQQGNHHQFDAWWSGMPQVRDSLPNSVIVVGASDPHRHVAWFSGTNINHDYVDIMAPGDSVYTLDQNGALVFQAGTSLATPLVTGAAGLLYSFDPALGDFAAGGAQELKSLILAGADSNLDVNGVLRTADGFRLLNLYEPLKLAAQRAGAPLCGNEVWIANGNVFARRTTGVQMIGATAGPHAWGANVMHGGHRLQYTDTSGVHTLDYGNPTWVAGPTNTVTDSIPGGTYRSLLLHSHDGDTAVSLSWADATTADGQPVERVSIALTDSYNSPERDTTFDVPAGPQGANMGGDPPCELCFFPRLAGISSVSGAYSPRSPRFLVVVNRDTASSVTLHPPSGGCSQSGSGTLSVHTLICGGTGELSATYVFTPEKADIYDVRVSNHAPWFTIVPHSTLPGAWVYWAGLSELDNETVAGIGSENDTSIFNTPSDNTSRVVTSCNIEYRDRLLASMTGGPAPVATNDACPDLQAGNGRLGSGTVSPSVAGRAPRLATPDGAATKRRASSARVGGVLKLPLGSAKRALPQ